MLATCVAVLGTADAAYHPGTPELTCVADQVRITATGPRRVTFSPIANDFTNDGAAVFLDTVQALDPSRGTLTRDGDILTYEAPDGFAGTFDLAYTAQSTTGATDDGAIAFIVDGTTTTPFCTGVPDPIDIDGSTTTLDYDVLANDSGSGPLEIMPGSLVQPPSGPTIAIVSNKLRVTRNGAGTGTYIGSYRPRLVDGSAVGDATQVTIRVVAATVTAADFAVTVPTSAAQPFKIDALARCSGTGPIELTPGGLTQPNGSTDSAAINGSGATGWIDYTRSTTPAGSYTMRYRVRLIANPGVEATGTITINVTAAWWRKSPIPGAREMFSGPGYFDASYPKWPEQIGAIGAITQQIMYRGTSDQSWEGIWGGSATQALNALTIQNKSQADWGNTFGAAARSIPPDSAFLCGVCELFPESWATATSATNRNERIYDEVASGRLDDGYLRFGARLYKAFRALGWTDTDWFILRPVHEMNQSNTCWVFKETRMRYRAMAERIFTKMREGFGARLRIVHSPARNARLNNKMTAEDYYDWVPQSASGGVDMLTVSFHPAGPVDTLANLDKFLRRWDSQSYGTIDDVLPSCVQLGLPYCNPEWSPRYEVKGSIQPCPIGDVVMQQMNKLLRAQAAQGNLVFETMFDQRQLIKTAYKGTDDAGKAAWSRMVDDIKALWKGQPKGAPPSLRITGSTSVNLSGDSLDFNAIGVMTGSEAVRIKRIVSTTGGLSASITGADANAKVRIQRGSASPGGGKKVVAEMTLQSIPFLVDLELSVSVGNSDSNIVKVHPLIGLTRSAGQIITPSDGQLKNNQPANANASSNQNFNNLTGFTSINGVTLDLRGKKFYNHSLNNWPGDDGAPGQNSPLRPTGFKDGLCIYGAEIIGEQPDDTNWANMKSDSPKAKTMDDNGILFPNPSVPAAATVYVEACIIRKQFDGINTDPRYGTNRANKGHYIIRGCYAHGIRDELVENDSCNYLEMYDTLVDSCHNLISMRPGGTSDAIPPDYSIRANRVKIGNVLARCRGQYFDRLLGGDSLRPYTKRSPQWEPGNGSVLVNNPDGFGPGYVHREPFKGDGVETFTNYNCTLWVDCYDSIFAFESFPTSGKVVFPPGDYENVWLLYLPDLSNGLTIGDLVDSRYVQARGVNVLVGSAARTMWDTERANWITAHGGYTSGGLLRFPFTEVP